MSLGNFWAVIDQQIAELEQARTADDVLRILATPGNPYGARGTGPGAKANGHAPHHPTRGMIIMSVLHALMWGFAHVRGTGPLWHYYLNHHAVRFLRSGVTSESPRTYGQARGLLWWLTTHRVNPVDW